MRKPFSSPSAKQPVEPAARGPLLAMRRRDFIAILGGHDGHASEGNASANARKLALCERTASEKWHPTYLRTLTDLMSEMGLGCVKTRRRSIAIEELVRPRPF